MPLLSETHSTNDPGHVGDHNLIARAANDYYGVVTDNPATGTTLNPDVGAGSVHVVNLPANGAVTLGPATTSTVPTYLAGQRACFMFVQGATGGCTVTFDASWGRVPDVSPGANAVTVVEFVNTGATGAAPTWRNRAPELGATGTLAQRRSPTLVPPGYTYYATDDNLGRASMSNGTSWQPMGAAVGDASGQELAYAEQTTVYSLATRDGTPYAVTGLTIVVPAGRPYWLDANAMFLGTITSAAVNADFRAALYIYDITGTPTWVASQHWRETNVAATEGAGAHSLPLIVRRRMPALASPATYQLYFGATATYSNAQLFASIGGSIGVPTSLSAIAR